MTLTPLKIGIDARMYGLEHTGIGRYVANLIDNLAAIDQTNSYHLFTSSPQSLNLPPNFTTIHAPIRHYTLKEQLLLPSIINRQELDLIHFPHFNIPVSYNRPFVVTIHDLLWHQTKGLSVTTLSPLIYSLKYLGYRAVVRHAINKASHVFTPSHFVKKQIIHRFNIPSSKISVTYEAPAHTFVPNPQIQPAKPPYLIYTGNLYPHKNIHNLILSLHHLPNFHLKLVSARSVFTPQLKQFVTKQHLANRVEFTGFLSDANLLKLYHHAFALLQPSRSEGFGLTGLEALASGLPVICSDIPIFTEIYQDSAFFTDTTSPQAIANTVLKLQHNPKLRANSLKQASILLKQYSWRHLATKTLHQYQIHGKVHP